MSTLYSIGHMNQVGDALEAAGYTPDDVTKLRSSTHLGAFKEVIRGHAKIVKVKHVIDCDADPFLPEGCKVEEHIKGGQFEWDPAKVTLYLSKKQKEDSFIFGKKLRKELAKQPVLNANALDYLLANPELIPEEWKGKAVCFWGTIYRNAGGGLSVRCLCWYGGQWYWGYYWLDGDFGGDDPAAVRASN